MNVNCLSVDAPFKVFETFGFQSGRTVDKVRQLRGRTAALGQRPCVPAALYQRLHVPEGGNYIDLGSHGMFICSVEEARVMSERETMTYATTRANVKPKPQTEGKKGFVCKVCGYIYEGDNVAGRLCLPAVQARRGPILRPKLRKKTGAFPRLLYFH